MGIFDEKLIKCEYCEKEFKRNDIVKVSLGPLEEWICRACLKPMLVKTEA
jgi:hypothetical protein